jgi:heme exporter protein A
MTPGSHSGLRLNLVMRLSASRLAAERGGRLIFSDLSFALDEGESLTVTGPNGAGKSTLLRALAGLLPLAAGTISLAKAPGDTLAENAHYVGHADAIKGLLTVAENLQFLAAMLDAGNGGMPVDAALAIFGLSHAVNLPVAYLSAGQKRRAALAKLLVVRRPIWLLDEPTTALDAASQAVMQEVMAGHLVRGGMIIAATHARLDLGGQELRLGGGA